MKDAREFVAWAKTQVAKANYGSPRNGTRHHLFMEQFKIQTGIQMTHIPYKGSAQAFQAGETDQGGEYQGGLSRRLVSQHGA